MSAGKTARSLTPRPRYVFSLGVRQPTLKRTLARHPSREGFAFRSRIDGTKAES
jgi:hypothetical protein